MSNRSSEQISSAVHLSDERLLHCLYFVDESDTHLTDCIECQVRLERMRAHGRQIEEESVMVVDPPVGFLFEQRRRIYTRLQPSLWPLPLVLSTADVPWRRWISAGAVCALLAGGLAVLNRPDPPFTVDDRISDVDLAQQVSQLSQGSTATAAQPLEALFE
jgi:hypothetical protein